MDELWLPTAIMEIYNYGDCGNKGFSFDLSVTRAVLSDGIECESAYSHNAFIKKKKQEKSWFTPAYTKEEAVCYPFII